MRTPLSTNADKLLSIKIQLLSLVCEFIYMTLEIQLKIDNQTKEMIN